MSDDEDYDSAEDQDYVPTDGEEVSEEENSGDEENLELLKDGEDAGNIPKKRKAVKKKSETRKRRGGIKLVGEDTAVKEDKDEFNKELEQQIRQEQEQKKNEQQKKKADDLWSSFMMDVGPRKTPAKTTAATSSGLGSLTSLAKPAAAATKSPMAFSSGSPALSSLKRKPQSTITVTQEYDFAGESVKVTKELDVNTKEGQAELRRQKEAASKPPETPEASLSPSGGLKRPAAGLGGVLDKINKKPKIGTLEKSKIDWEAFKAKEGISEELKIHNRGKESYIERMNFLQRSDVRQFEIEKNLRMNTSKR